MRFGAAILALGWCVASAQAQEAEGGPDLDFLEYLGAWAEDDDEWLAIEEWEKDTGTEPDENAAGSETERDHDDESDDESD